jgi:hypothetical protein
MTLEYIIRSHVSDNKTTMEKLVRQMWKDGFSAKETISTVDKMIEQKKIFLNTEKFIINRNV